MKIVLFLGYSGSGKTSAIEQLLKGLTKSGRWRVGTLKHVHDSFFSIDKQGKDTWRYMQAGATTVVALAPDELAIINRENTAGLSLDSIISIFKEQKIDYVLVEGLYRKFETEQTGNDKLVRILCAARSEDARELLGKHPSPLCICGKIVNTLGDDGDFQGIPLVRFPRDIEKVLSMIGDP